MEYCVALAILQSSMQGLSNLSMRYLNYPAKVLFKSSRVLPTMLFGVVLYGACARVALVILLLLLLLLLLAPDA